MTSSERRNALVSRHLIEERVGVHRDFQTIHLLRMMSLFPGNPRYRMLLGLPAVQRQGVARAMARTEEELSIMLVIKELQAA